MRLNKTCCCAAVLIGALANAPSCLAAEHDKASLEEVKKEVQDLLHALSGYAVGQREEAVRKTKAALDTLDQHIETLEQQVDDSWDKMDKAARTQARIQLKELHKQRTLAAEWYGSLKNGSSNAWEQAKKGFAEAYKALDEAWEKSKKEFSADKK